MGIFSSKDPEKEAASVAADAERQHADAVAARDRAIPEQEQIAAAAEAGFRETGDPSEARATLEDVRAWHDKAVEAAEMRMYVAQDQRDRARVAGSIQRAAALAEQAKTEGRAAAKHLTRLLAGLAKVRAAREQIAPTIADAWSPAHEDVAREYAAERGTALERRGVMGQMLPPAAALAEIITEQSAYLDPVGPDEIRALEGLLVELREAAGAKERAAREKAFQREQREAEKERRKREAAERLARDRAEAAAR